MSDTEQSQTPTNDVKPESQQEDSKEMLGIKVTDNSTEVYFRVKRTTPLRRVMDGFCKRTGKDPKSLRFMYDGERINYDDTPESLGMEDSDQIEALNAQTGGSF